MLNMCVCTVSAFSFRQNTDSVVFGIFEKSRLKCTCLQQVMLGLSYA